MTEHTITIRDPQQIDCEPQDVAAEALADHGRAIEALQAAGDALARQARSSYASGLLNREPGTPGPELQRLWEESITYGSLERYKQTLKAAAMLASTIGSQAAAGR